MCKTDNIIAMTFALGSVSLLVHLFKKREMLDLSHAFSITCLKLTARRDFWSVHLPYFANMVHAINQFSYRNLISDYPIMLITKFNLRLNKISFTCSCVEQSSMHDLYLSVIAIYA